jgi:Transposase DDE domain
MSLLNLFVDVDDFCQILTDRQSPLLAGRANRPGRKPNLTLSEVMTIIVYFHMSRYRDFKTYYTQYVQQHLRREFPNLVSYSRFVELMPPALRSLCLYLKSRFGPVTGISFIDATALPVCHNRRIGRHQVFDGLAARGKTSMGWFFGFKLHLVVNDCGELLAFYVTPGNVDDRQPVPRLAQRLFGKLFGDKGYISQPLADQLLAQDVQLITGLRKNMKNRLLLLFDKLMLRKRVLIETITDQLKNISQVAHTRHRSVDNFLVNLVAGLIAYTHQPKKPSLNLRDASMALLPATLI